MYLHEAKGRGLSTSLDPGCDPAGKWDTSLKDLSPWLDVLLVNQMEASALEGRGDWHAAALGLARRVSMVVVKRGRAGAMAMRKGARWEQAGFRVEVADPTGAGDAFSAGFLFGWLAGWPMPECLRWGIACGAMTAARPGGSGAFDNQTAVQDFIDSQGKS